jgi:transcriptional regulator with XRE-family HTH domain
MRPLIIEPVTDFYFWRQAQGLTQKEAAMRLGLTEAHVRHLESGRRRLLPRHRMLMGAVTRGIELPPWQRPQA